MVTGSGDLKEKHNAALACSRVHFALSVLLVPNNSAPSSLSSVIPAIEHLDHCLLLSGPSSIYIDRIARLEENFAVHIALHNRQWQLGDAPFSLVSSSRADGLPDLQSPPVLSAPSFEECASIQHSPFVCQDWTVGWEIMAVPDVFKLLAAKFGHRLVPVEVGSSYVDTDWKVDIMPLGQVVQAIRNKPSRPETLYMAQHELFDQLPGLKTLLSPLPFILDAKECIMNAWLGPAGTTTPLHTDPYDNVLVQVRGIKMVYLLDPKFSTHLSIDHDASSHGNTSNLTIDMLLHLKLPLLGIQITPGDALFIPKGWWHMVIGLSESFSISFWHHAE